jgi:N-acyl-D-amino-acid deacylase
MARESFPADAEQLRQMQELIAAGLADGAVGLSSGLDYVPGMFSGTQELMALCEPVPLA